MEQIVHQKLAEDSVIFLAGWTSKKKEGNLYICDDHAYYKALRIKDKMSNTL